MRLQLVGFDALHVLADMVDHVDIHDILGQRALVQQFLERFAVHGMIYDLIQPCANLRVVAVTHGINQQIAQGTIFKGDLAQNIKDLAA